MTAAECEMLVTCLNVPLHFSLARMPLPAYKLREFQFIATPAEVLHSLYKMKTLIAIAVATFAFSGCAVYHGHHADHPGAKKPHPHGCPPGQAKKGRC